MFSRTAIFAIRNLRKNHRNLKYFSSLICRPLPKCSIKLYNNDWNEKINFCSNSKPTEHVVDSILDHATYDRVCYETLNELNDYFEKLLETVNLPNSDLAYSDGVLTIKLGSQHGTYVINRQTPNRQIWLSSPTSGPKRYDFVGRANGTAGKWVYRRSGQSLHQLLQKELQKIFKTQKVDFEDLPYGKYIN